MAWATQSEDDDFIVRANTSYCKDGEERTDFEIIDRKTGEKAHYSIDGEANDGELTMWHDFE